MQNETDVGAPGRVLLTCINAIIDAATSKGIEENETMRKLVATALLASAQMHFDCRGSDQEFLDMAARALSFVSSPSAMDH